MCTALIYYRQATCMSTLQHQCLSLIVFTFTLLMIMYLCTWQQQSLECSKQSTIHSHIYLLYSLWKLFVPSVETYNLSCSFGVCPSAVTLSWPGQRAALGSSSESTEPLASCINSGIRVKAANHSSIWFSHSMKQDKYYTLIANLALSFRETTVWID